MAHVLAVPAMLSAAASDLAGIGSTLSSANATAAAQTIAVVPAAGDEVSAAIASLFSSHAQAYQAIGARATAFCGQFVQSVNDAAGAYASAEAANAAPLQAAERDVLAVLKAPTNSVLGRPLIGNGNGGAVNGGLLLGGTGGGGGGIRGVSLPVLGGGGTGGWGGAGGVVAKLLGSGRYIPAANTANSASSVAADIAPAAESYGESYFANMPTLPFTMGAFNLNLGNVLNIYNDGGILPWQYGFGVDLLDHNRMFNVIAESQGNAYGSASLISVDVGTLGFSNIEAYGNLLGGNYAIISDQFDLYGVNWADIFTAKNDLFFNAPPAYEWSIPSFISSGELIPDMTFPLGSTWD